ncbi:MAG TPA: 16S rRNA (adenine(1518)-N(6)/adenine(1519)-N(6))-dimethyltransferase RsmA [Candidatus Paceibacterota bacterium]|jgi:16S rRNA (adenine1518-N6/adenine1519-N6)-dimethyltransferase|nr:16S rRNA (adenine(1518)-N(6)/adenine(1519)-N(6))-dimethyltransferase RsmA [Candidatus Paceibacterota bacterium]
MYKKKSLGQHFLHNRHYLGMVADAADITKGETVLEIGPGEGALTHVLLERGAKVVAIEKDSRLMSVLQEKFDKEIKNKTLEVIEGDALEFEPKFKNYKVVGNIPYYITGALFKKFLSGTRQPSLLVFLIQKEVAERIARSKKESILSLSVKAYGEPKYIKTVPAGAFVPPPKVDSAILLVSNVSRKNFKNVAHEENFFDLIKKAFGSKRKMLRSTLGIDSSERPEDLTLEQWLALSK